MIHAMGLFEEPFYSIKSGRKTVEVRLNDEKRRKIGLGDIIQFTILPKKNEILNVEVIELRKYPTFEEMYKDIPYDCFDTHNDSINEMVEQTYEIYSPEQEKDWGTLAITIKLI
ncbi:ASCH domain-containing protein [Lederbergia lenta]|uniref:Cytoplasmic protein n=1 Tax=Lederbergia lenta TaxID=1467 RepID=A0A2X4W6G8_LEDLE|nr:ASCH domain-containing protein [Lederbergia lenta]MEC2324656.1 ASCH domain-containing protein [Lederbergia lenta]SQI58741.1 cytoplasmic protein [Lederbergia lenta]